MIRKHFDKFTILVKEKRMWVSIWIRIAIRVYVAQQQSLRVTVRLEAAVKNRAEAVGGMICRRAFPSAQRSGSRYATSQCSPETEKTGTCGRIFAERV